MTKEQLKYFIATDRYGLLRDNENRLIYALKRIVYRFQGYHKRGKEGTPCKP